MTSLALAALFWIALHVVVAGVLRPRLVGVVGDRAYLGLFALSSAGGLAWLIIAYGAAPFVPLYAPPPGARAINGLLMLAAFIFLAYSLGAGNPTAVGSDLRFKAGLPVQGMTRITRHPMLWAFALWAVAHLLVNGDAASVLLFGAILVTALNGMASIDRKRRRALGPVWDDFAAHTSRVPFAAILAGRNQLALGELGFARLGLGVALFIAALLLHGPVLGVSPLAP